MLPTTKQPVVEISLFIVTFFTIWSIRATFLYSIDEAIASDSLRLVYASVVKLVLWGLPALGFAYWKQRSAPLQYLGVSVSPSGGQWIWSLIVTGVFLSIVIGVDTLTGRKVLSFAALSGFFTFTGLLSAFYSPFIEEVLFRGVFLKEISSILPGWVANLITSLLFVGIHLPFWLSHNAIGVVLANSVGVLIFSLVAGWLYLKSRSIWPPMVAHVANNIVASLLVVLR